MLATQFYCHVIVGFCEYVLKNKHAFQTKYYDDEFKTKLSRGKLDILKDCNKHKAASKTYVTKSLSYVQNKKLR